MWGRGWLGLWGFSFSLLGFCSAFVSRGRVSSRRARYLFFASPKKSTQKKGDPTVCDPFRLRRAGQPVSCRAWDAPRNSLRCFAATFRQPRRARQRCVCVLRRTRSPHALPDTGASTREWGSHTGHRCARPFAQALAPRPRPSAAMARVGCWLFNSLLYAPRSAAGGVACVPKDTQASLSGLPQLFERSAQRAVSSAAHPAREHRRLPRSAAKGTQTAGSPFLCLLSFGEAKESECAAGRITRPREAISQKLSKR